jgi:hypothetical protein
MHADRFYVIAYVFFVFAFLNSSLAVSIKVGFLTSLAVLPSLTLFAVNTLEFKNALYQWIEMAGFFLYPASVIGGLTFLYFLFKKVDVEEMGATHIQRKHVFLFFCSCGSSFS